METMLPDHKTRIVATIGPACDAPEMLERLMRAGLNVARLNFSHGDFSAHAARIDRIRSAEAATGCRVAIMADLPGPKMRLGTIAPEPIFLRPGDSFTLTTEQVVGNAQRVSVTFEPLPRVVKAGDQLFLNDGLVQLRVERVEGVDARCRVAVGGELRSRKGLNLPGIELGISAFTEHDRACLEFALDHGVDAVSQSFVETEADIQAVRALARSRGKQPFIIAKIERAGALAHFDEILKAADGIMVARGDLGVEVPIQRIALTQKELIAKANLAGKPVITATQMLESMTTSRLPTRAEATDVANAILDGTDCLMLSAESAMGQYPEEAVRMLASIAAATESGRPHGSMTCGRRRWRGRPPRMRRRSPRSSSAPWKASPVRRCSCPRSAARPRASSRDLSPGSGSSPSARNRRSAGLCFSPTGSNPWKSPRTLRTGAALLRTGCASSAWTARWQCWWLDPRPGTPRRTTGSSLCGSRRQPAKRGIEIFR